MADLIERDALLDEIGEFQIRFNETGDSHERVAYASAEHCMLVIKAAPAVNRWISVKDDLPEKDKSYITYAETTKYCNHNEIPEELRINILYFNGEEWYDEECIYYNVTHYMPLPEPPEKE